MGLILLLLFFQRPTAQLSLASSHISLEDRTKLDEERERLYQLLDSKVRKKLYFVAYNFQRLLSNVFAQW